MSLKALWIFPVTPESDSGVINIFSRFYQTYIGKAKQIDKEHYVPIPANQEFAKRLLFELGHTKDGLTKFIPQRDSCQRVDQKPVYELEISTGKLWPVVVVEQHGFLFSCLPFVQQGAFNRPSLIDIPGVTLGFTLLCALSDFLRNTPASELTEKSKEVYGFLSQAAPFGTLLDTTVDSVIVKMTNKPCPTPKTQKQPAWKPVLHKGKNQIYIYITESIRAVQYDRNNIEDVWDIYGTVSCKAELEGTMPTVTMTISHTAEGETTPLDHLLIHPCVQSADAYVLEEGRDRAVPRRVRFSPPLQMITLCHYTVCRTNTLPITGSFEMFVEELRVKVNVHLRLSENIKNQFEYCELQIPFKNSGQVTIQEASQNHGAVVLSPNKTILVWNIGQRFPAKSDEINMSAVLQLGDSQPSRTGSFVEEQSAKTGSLEEQFCVGQNAYAQLFFKINDFTLSGCFIDPKSIQVAPSMKYKLTPIREFVSAEYKFWNSHGDSLVSTIPKCLYESPDQTSADT